MSFTEYPNYGDIYIADLGEYDGHKQGGVRPIIITSNNVYNLSSPTLNYIALTSQKKTSPVHVYLKKNEINGLNCDSVAIVEQEGTINKYSLRDRIGRLDEAELTMIAKAYVIQHPFLQLIMDDRRSQYGRTA